MLYLPQLIMTTQDDWEGYVNIEQIKLCLAQMRGFLRDELEVKIAKLDKNADDYEKRLLSLSDAVDLVKSEIDTLQRAYEYENKKPLEQQDREFKQYKKNKKNGIPGWKVPGELDFK